MSSSEKILNQKTIYPTWINEFGYGIPITVIHNENGTITVKDDNSPRQSTGTSIGEAMDKLNKLTEDARMTGDL